MTELMSISGKPRDLCIRALAAAQNIPDVAFEFLMSGYIPEVGEGGGYDDEADAQDDGGAGAGGMPGAGGGGGLGGYNLDAQTM